jgi:hypothetical protein
MEEIHDHTPGGEQFGVGFSWWDKSKGLQGLWCVNTNPQGCDLQSTLGGFSPKWDGKQLVIHTEFPRDGKTFVWHEVFSDITENSFTQTADIGEKGGELKRWLTIHATKITETGKSTETALGSSAAGRSVEMHRLSNVLAGRWSGTLTSETGSREVGHADETWRMSPGGLTVVEENHLSTSKEDSFDYAAVWWNRKTQKYQGIWCAEINDEGCSGFDATLKGNQVEMTGEWERNGNRRAWHEVFSRPDQDSSIQTLDIGEPGGELKRVSVINATKITEGSTDSWNIHAEAELRAFMAELRKASIEGDAESMANSMADDYVQTDINGYRQDKTTWLNEYFRPLSDLIKAGKFHWDEYERKDLQFRFYGDCAIVTGELQARRFRRRPMDEGAILRSTAARFCIPFGTILHDLP